MDAPGIRILLCPDGLGRGSRLRRGVPRHGRLPGSDPLDTPEGRCRLRTGSR